MHGVGDLFRRHSVENWCSAHGTTGKIELGWSVDRRADLDALPGSGPALATTHRDLLAAMAAMSTGVPYAIAAGHKGFQRLVVVHQRRRR